MKHLFKCYKYIMHLLEDTFDVDIHVVDMNVACPSYLGGTYYWLK